MRPTHKLIEKTTEAIINHKVDTIFCELLRGLGFTDEEIEEARNYDYDTYERYWFRNRQEK